MSITVNRTLHCKLNAFFLAGLGAAFLLLSLPSVAPCATNGQVDEAPPGLSATSGLAPDFTARPGFTSHLPLLVIEPEPGGPASLHGASADLLLHDHVEGNALQASPQASFKVVLHEEPGQQGQGKKTYSLELASPESDAVALAGLPASRQWRLQGSLRDKGMLRNGLAYAAGRILIPQDTPQTRYCEVFFKDGDTFRYQGLFILVETAAQLFQSREEGKENVLFEYSPQKDKRRSAREYSSDRDLFGWSLEDKGFTAIVAPEENRGALEARVEVAMVQMENRLSATTPGGFLPYLALLDQDSVIDLYILNELFLNAQDDPAAFTLTLDAKGRLHLAPAWQFDAALDSAATRLRPLPFEEEASPLLPPSILARRVPIWRQFEEGATLEDLRLYPLYQKLDAYRFLWFDRLFLSRSFLLGLYERYSELRRGPLSSGKISAMVDALAMELGPALERDWRRWATEYEATGGPAALAPYIDPQGESHVRQTFSYAQELVKIRFCLIRQDNLLITQLRQAEWLGADLFAKETSGNRQAGYALLALVGFMTLSHILTRRL